MFPPQLHLGEIRVRRVWGGNCEEYCISNRKELVKAGFARAPAGVPFSSVVAWWSHLHLHLRDFRDPRRTGHGRTNDDWCSSSLEHSGNFQILEQRGGCICANLGRKRECTQAESSEVKEGHGSYSHPEAFIFCSQDTFEYQTKSCVFLPRELVNSNTEVAFKVCGPLKVRQFKVI